ncbi:type II secretion system F family protein [Phenylobacterium montanum]|uniref:Type II secretion system F family protein n=1 Tax=Phenylobacterium montanum TaxID=2823693 RepID=A0A975IX51_9CAUL|nr:type II secretion system F family protein [Caulobacter sp. S6]
MVFFILLFGAVFSAGQAIWGVLTQAQAKRVVNKRLVVAEKIQNVADRVVELRKQRGLNAEGRQGLPLAWLADLIVRSGVAYDPRRWAVIGAGLAIGGAFLGLMLGHSPVAALLGALAGGLGAPFAYLNVRAGMRAKALGQQLPNALEIICRSLEAGHPVPTAISLVGRELGDPIGSEFGMAADEISFGATLEQAVARMADRCRHPDFDLFAATIRLQERAGGNLVGLLKMNAHTVRERQKMRMKIKAASSEGRTSAMILTSAPFFVFAILLVMAPHFYGDVIHKKPIQVGLSVLGGWMFLGNLVMNRMISMKI